MKIAYITNLLVTNSDFGLEFTNYLIFYHRYYFLLFIKVDNYWMILFEFDELVSIFFYYR